MKAITANRLTDGRVIYRTRAQGWTAELSEAWRLDEAEAEPALATAEAERDVMVGPYLIEIDADGPAGQKHRRETIRLTGPTAGTTRLLS